VDVYSLFITAGPWGEAYPRAHKEPMECYPSAERCSLELCIVRDCWQCYAWVRVRMYVPLWYGDRVRITEQGHALQTDSTTHANHPPGTQTVWRWGGTATACSVLMPQHAPGAYVVDAVSWKRSTATAADRAVRWSSWGGRAAEKVRVEERPPRGARPVRQQKYVARHKKPWLSGRGSLPFLYPRRCLEQRCSRRHWRASEAALAGNPL